MKTRFPIKTSGMTSSCFFIIMSPPSASIGDMIQHPREHKDMTKNEPLKKVPCPVCNKEAAWRGNPFRPFCSERCRLIDLGKWASEDYRIPGEKKEVPEGEGDEKNKGGR